MFDNFLAYVVIFGPIVLAVILVPDLFKKQQPGDNRYRLSIFAFCCILGFLTYWQQRRATNAAVVEQEKAIENGDADTTARVTLNVTKVVTDFYSKMISDQQTQIADLRMQLSNQLTSQGTKIDSGFAGLMGQMSEGKDKKQLETDYINYLLQQNKDALAQCARTSPPGEGGAAVGECLSAEKTWVASAKGFVYVVLGTDYGLRFDDTSSTANLATVQLGMNRRVPELVAPVRDLVARANMLKEFLKEL